MHNITNSAASNSPTNSQSEANLGLFQNVTGELTFEDGMPSSSKDDNSKWLREMRIKRKDTSDQWLAEFDESNVSQPTTDKSKEGTTTEAPKESHEAPIARDYLRAAAAVNCVPTSWSKWKPSINAARSRHDAEQVTRGTPTENTKKGAGLLAEDVSAGLPHPHPRIAEGKGKDNGSFHVYQEEEDELATYAAFARECKDANETKIGTGGTSKACDKPKCH